MPVDYSGQNLQGKSFKGQNLKNADFSDADIRGANFTGAILTGANFSRAKHHAIFLVFFSWLLAGMSGVLFALNSFLASLIFDSSSLENRVAGWVAIVISIIFFFILVRRGMQAALGAFAVAGAVVSAYIGWRAIKGDKKQAIIRNTAVAFAAFGGTSFRNADLTDANFTLANLKNSDFRSANLTRTCFRKVKKLDFVRPGNTYLKSFQLLQVLVTGNGREKNFDREDLRGINLRGANLVGSSFIAADLSAANLQDSDLSRAKLVQTQLDATDFTGATLTGAFIEDWNITTHTNFTGVRCEFVYMRLPTKDNPEPLRKPDNREEVFGDGEFGDFIKPIVDTLDLYHNQGVDPRAIAIAFKELEENNPEANLEIVAME